MAERDKSPKSDGKGEDYEFLPPDFDEDQFIHREMVSFKTTLILFAWGIIAAGLSWALFGAMDGAKTGWLVGLLVCTAFFLALRPLFKQFKADIKHWGRREWVGTGFLFFFTWLGVFIVAVNPPVSDYAPPRVDVFVGPPLQQEGGLVTLDVFFEDNDRVAEHEFQLTRNGAPVVGTAALQDLGRGHYRYVQSLPAGVYEVTATAEDRKGNRETQQTTFAVVDRVLEVFLPDQGTLDSPTDEVFVQVASEDLPRCTRGNRNDPCVRTVHLDLQGGGRVVLEFDAPKGGWRATSNFAGWSQGTNTFNVTAEVVDAWSGNVLVPGGDLVSGPYMVNVTVAPGTYAPKVLADPNAVVRDVPGLELPLLLAGLLAVALVARRR